MAYFPQIGCLNVVWMEYFHAKYNDLSIFGVAFHVWIAPHFVVDRGVGH